MSRAEAGSSSVDRRSAARTCRNRALSVLCAVQNTYTAASSAEHVHLSALQTAQKTRTAHVSPAHREKKPCSVPSGVAHKTVGRESTLWQLIESRRARLDLDAVESVGVGRHHRPVLLRLHAPPKSTHTPRMCSRVNFTTPARV
eukprot:2153101-Rhodomonas_salina.2